MSEDLNVIALRPFVPASVFATSFRFYADLGFTPRSLGPQLAVMQLGPFSFFLQDYRAEGFAESYMMQLLVNDLDAWWSRIAALDLATRYGVQSPRPPAMQPWGLRVAYVFDPSGVLWHIAEDPASP